MSLESILDRIISDADTEKEKLIREAKEKAQRLTEEAKEEAERRYEEIIKREKAIYDGQKQKAKVAAHLDAKKDLLKTKQELIGLVFEKLKSNIGKSLLKKEQVTHEKVKESSEEPQFYLNRLKFEYEGEVARILFE